MEGWVAPLHTITCRLCPHVRDGFLRKQDSLVVRVALQQNVLVAIPNAPSLPAGVLEKADP